MAKEKKADPTELVLNQTITVGRTSYMINTKPPSELVEDFDKNGYLSPRHEVEMLLRPETSDLDKKAKILEQENIELRSQNIGLRETIDNLKATIENLKNAAKKVTPK